MEPSSMAVGMESSCIPHTDLPQTSKLFADFVYHFGRVSSYYRGYPGDLESYPAAARQIRYPKDRREQLVAALREQNPGHPSLELLAQPDTLAVVTGQQVGLFSGPAYTIYKALTAARLARSLTERGIPCVPIFWLATEDHDLEEINHCWVFNGEQQPVKLEVPGTNPTHQPVGRIRIEEAPVRGLREALRDLPFGDEVAKMVEETYLPGATFGAAFPALLQRILPTCGLLYVDPMHASVRAMAAPLIRQFVENAPELTRLLLERNHELADRGYHAQVHVESHTSLVFLLEGESRLTLRRQDGEYVTNGRKFSAEELAERAEHLSPNALLRPVVQDYVLPTVAYVGGPAELAYLAQAEVIYRSLLGRMPVAVPRAGFTLLDARGDKLMRRYDLALKDFFHGDECLCEELAGKLVPPALSAAFRETKPEVAAALDKLGSELVGFDRSLASSFEKSRRKILYQLSKIERKTGRESFRRQARAQQDAVYLCGLVYPHKHLQERFYSILPFLARHGVDLIAQLYDNVHLDCPDHLLLVA
jgi:bacillithiol biosynthesis cysteine-adding enzyme BshC